MAYRSSSRRRSEYWPPRPGGAAKRPSFPSFVAVRSYYVPGCTEHVQAQAKTRCANFPQSLPSSSRYHRPPTAPTGVAQSDARAGDNGPLSAASTGRSCEPRLVLCGGSVLLLGDRLVLIRPRPVCAVSEPGRPNCVAVASHFRAAPFSVARVLIEETRGIGTQEFPADGSPIISFRSRDSVRQRGVNWHRV